MVQTGADPRRHSSSDLDESKASLGIFMSNRPRTRLTRRKNMHLHVGASSAASVAANAISGSRLRAGETVPQLLK